jgi:hypothetical protein
MLGGSAMKRPNTKRHELRFAAALILGVFGLAGTPGLEATITFEFLGDLPGGPTFSQALGISADGSFVVGASTSAASGSALEGFVWEAASRTMVGIGDLPGGRFASTAVDVSADGQIVVGSSEDFEEGTLVKDRRSLPIIWRRGGAPAMVALATSDILYPRLTELRTATCTGISDDGAVLVGVRSYRANGVTTTSTGFYQLLTRLSFTFLPPVLGQSALTAVAPSGSFMVGTSSVSGAPISGFRADPFVVANTGQFTFDNLGQVGNVATRPTSVSADGARIVGDFFPATGPRGVFLYEQDGQPPYTELALDGRSARAISGDGRVALDSQGGMFLDGRGPFDLRQMLAEAGVRDFLALDASQFSANALSTDGFVVAGAVILDGVTQAWRVTLSDCDENGLPDELEELADTNLAAVIAEGSQRFAASRETLGYGDMVSRYGKPWKPGTDRVPERDVSQPAEFLRAALRFSGCNAAIRTQAGALRYLAANGFPSVSELHDFEMLLGNEAFSDALDPTIGLDGIAPDDLGNQFAFKGVAGIQDLLDEELALQRGRELPGAPSDWLNEAVYYPELTGPGNEKRTVAVYNRLPPNASAASGVAYRSNYGVADNFEAALKFPQGHGDAYGHYLSALKTTLLFLRDGPEGWPETFLDQITELMASTDAGLETVRHIAEAGTGLAQSAAQVADLLYRRDYRENPQDPRALELFNDPQPERAWSMGDWARRGALGAYVSWGAAAHFAPTDEAKVVHRAGLPELGELAGAVAGFQERLDTAGAGLDPLGLVQNVVPFGIDASGLDENSGRSHYEQVRDAATRAIDNARKAFESANQADQRLRDSDKQLDQFTERLEDTKADGDQQLIEIFGLPSPSDPQDNDLDPSTTDLQESQSHPDLTSFLATDEALAAQGLGARPAPGQVQLAISELKIAALRVERAELDVSELEAEITSQMERIQLLVEVQLDRIQIITKARDDMIALTDRMEQIAERKKSAGFFGSFTKAVIGAAAGNPSGLIDYVGQVVTETADAFMTGDEGTEFDVERERTRGQAWKEIELQELEDKLVIDAETRRLKELIRRTPQVLVDLTIAQELASQALGRLRQSIERGRLILRNRRRLETRTEGALLEERWTDMSFRVFRNASLKNYRAFFDIAARYVVLAARAYAYEFDARSDGEDALAGIYRERRLGSASGLGGGLQSVLNRLDAAVTVNNFNRPLETLGERSFSLRRNLLGIGADDFPNDDLKLRAFLESQIVDRIEDLVEINELAQVSVGRDYGPGIVLSFATEIDSRNFFGRGPELPFGNSNFSLTRNAKIRSYAIRLDGVDASLGTDPESGTVFVYLLPAGESVLRENTNKPRIEDELITPWAVVDQFLPVPPLALNSDFSRRSYNPWRSAAQASGNFLNEIKRQRDSEAQIELGQSNDKTRFNTNLAGRSAWNTRWLLVIPGKQWTSSTDVSEIRRRLLQFIYGTRADPAQHVGITDIRLIIQAYSH